MSKERNAVCKAVSSTSVEAEPGTSLSIHCEPFHATVQSHDTFQNHLTTKVTKCAWGTSKIIVISPEIVSFHFSPIYKT